MTVRMVGQSGASPANSRPAVRHVSRFDPVGDRKAEYVDQEVPLPPFRALVPVESTNATTFGCLHRLPIHDDRCGLWLPTGCQANQRIQCAMQQHPVTSHAPAPEVAVRGRPRRKITEKLPPVAACADQIDDCVEYGGHVCCTWTTAGVRCWDVRATSALCVGQITRVVNRHELG
jgi:hypothetical protein